MQEQYKMLTKKVRKTRSALEIVEDAIILYKEGHNLATMKRKKVRRNPPNAFSTFCKSKRASLVEKHPDLKFRDIHKKLCERWKELSDEKREKYVLKAEKAKEEFYEEVKKIEEEEISKIKKPLCAFDMWKSERIRDGGLDEHILESELILEWGNLPKTTRKGWLQAAASEREKYNLEVMNVRCIKDKKKIKKGTKDMAPASDSSKAKGNPTSEENCQSSSSLMDNTPSKRKLHTPKEEVKSPAKKAKKQESSDSEDSESSSNED